MNYYDVLKLKNNSTQDEIKEAYLLLSKMLHPDKFNPINQKAQWDKANEILKELNEAYNTLKNPDLRKEYDERIRQSTGGSKNASHKVVKSGKAQIENLPSEIQARLEQLSIGNYPGSLTLKIDGPTKYNAIGIGCVIFTLYLLAQTYAARWGIENTLAFSFLAIAIGVAISFAIIKIKAHNSRRIKSGVYSTTLHLIVIKEKLCTYYWRRDLKDFKLIHNTKEGKYVGSQISFIFNDGRIDLEYRNIKAIEDIIEYLSQTDKYIDSLVSEQYWDDLDRENIFLGAEELTEQHLMFKPRDHKLELQWKIAGICVACFAIAINTANYYLSELYSWSKANTIYTMNSYKSYLNTSTLRYYESEAEDSCWSLALSGDKISSIRDYLSGNRVMKYNEKAKIEIKRRYNEILKNYNDLYNANNHSKFSAILSTWIDRAIQTGQTSIKISFISKNNIPKDFAESIKSKNAFYKNILPITNEFSEAENLRRENDVLNKFKAAFSAMIPEDALVISRSNTAATEGSDIVVSYQINPGNALYYRAEDENAESRPYYPGIAYNWDCTIYSFGRLEPYNFAFQSNPKQQFSDTKSGVYNDMANSAFEDLDSNLKNIISNKHN